MADGVTIGALKRLSLYMAGQRTNAVSITGGTITGATISGTISSSTVGSTAQLDKTTDATLADVPGLIQTVVPGTYTFNINLMGTSGASGGWKVAFNYATTVLSSLNSSARAYTASAVAVANSTTATAQATLLGVTAANISGQITGLLVVTTGGTIQVQFAQNASNGTTSSIYVGSTLQLVRIA